MMHASSPRTRKRIHYGIEIACPTLYLHAEIAMFSFSIDIRNHILQKKSHCAYTFRCADMLF